MFPVSSWLLWMVVFSCWMLLGCNSREALHRKAETVLSQTPNPSVTAESEISMPRSQETSSQDRVALHVEVSGFAVEQGNCRIAMYIGPNHFNNPDYAIARAAIPIVDSKAIWMVDLDRKELATNPIQSTPLRLAVSAYHDVNENSQLDKSSFGIPTERYGFSNQPKRGFGPPKFEEAAILIVEGKPLEPQRIQISVY